MNQTKKLEVQKVMNNKNAILLSSVICVTFFKIGFWFYFWTQSVDNANFLIMNQTRLLFTPLAIAWFYSLIVRIILSRSILLDENFLKSQINPKLFAWTLIIFPILAVVQIIKKVFIKYSNQPKDPAVLIFKLKWLFIFKEILYILNVVITITMLSLLIKDSLTNFQTAITFNLQKSIYIALMIITPAILTYTVLLLIVQFGNVYYDLQKTMNQTVKWRVPGFLLFLPFYWQPIINIIKLKDLLKLKINSNKATIQSNDIVNISINKLVAYLVTIICLFTTIGIAVTFVSNANALNAWHLLTLFFLITAFSVYIYHMIHYFSEIYMHLKTFKQWLLHFSNMLLPVVSCINIYKHYKNKPIIV